MPPLSRPRNTVQEDAQKKYRYHRDIDIHRDLTDTAYCIHIIVNLQNRQHVYLYDYIVFMCIHIYIYIYRMCNTYTCSMDALVVTLGRKRKQRKRIVLESPSL